MTLNSHIMKENPKYRFRISEFEESKGEEQQPIKKPERQEYYVTGASKSLDLHMLDGNRHLVSYSYLIYGRLIYGDDMQKLSLFFTTHHVIIEGYRLEKLYEYVLGHSLRMVKALGERYLAIADEKEPFVMDITIKWHGKDRGDEMVGE